jgi:hypothetical protein
MLSESVFVSRSFQGSVEPAELGCTEALVGCTEALVMPGIQKPTSRVTESKGSEPTCLTYLTLKLLAIEGVLNDQRRSFGGYATKYSRHVLADVRIESSFLEQKRELARTELAKRHGVQHL